MNRPESSNDVVLDDSPSEAERWARLAPGAFPFESRYLDVGGATLHYVDEGKGPVLLMIHGNPTWSIVFRDLIVSLRGSYRCVAVDLAGFGMSWAPEGFSFEPEAHARLVTGFVESLDLDEATLVAHDWGGPIGIAVMMATGRRIVRLCLGNTWAWPVNGDLHFEWFSRLMGGAIGRFATNRFCAFVNVFMPASMKRRRLTAAEMTAYRAPFRQRASRRPMHVFPAAIIGSGEWLGRLDAFVRTFNGPVAFIWPADDIAFREKELDRWLSLLPQAAIFRLANCGHYLWLDAPAECAYAVDAFMESARPLSQDGNDLRRA